MPDRSNSGDPSIDDLSKPSAESPNTSSGDHPGTSDGCTCHSQEHWKGINIDLDELQAIVCKFFRVPPSDCGPPVEMGTGNFARVYSFQLPERKVVARLVYPVKPLFKTENEVAAMDFVRSRTSLPVPKVFTYCSEANNPVGVEWLIMEHMPGVEMDEAWDDFGYVQKRRLALDIIDLYDQLYKLKADGCGCIYHTVNSVDDSGTDARHQRSPRWMPLSQESLSLLKSLCNHSVHNNYELGPFNDVSMIRYHYPVPSPSATLPVFSSLDYIKLAAYNGNPTTRSEFDFPTREKCVELFENVYKLYPHSTVVGPSSDSVNFCFSHGDLHGGNILIDPATGAITGIIDWESAAFLPLWLVMDGIEWFSEDRDRFIYGCWAPENFEDDTGPHDAELRAFFRTEMYKRNPHLFSAFFGAIELRAIYHAATDEPLPNGQSNIFLDHYHDQGFWNEKRRGAFPWDMDVWTHKLVDIDIKVMGMMIANGTMREPAYWAQRPEQSTLIVIPFLQEPFVGDS